MVFGNNFYFIPMYFIHIRTVYLVKMLVICNATLPFPPPKKKPKQITGKT